MKIRWPTQIAWLIITTCAIFVFGISWTGNELATRIENYIGITLSVACIVRYRHDAWKALVQERSSSVQLLGLGIVLAWLANSFRNLYSTLQRDFNIDWLPSSWVVPTFLFIMLLSGILHVMVPKVHDGVINRRAIKEISIYVLIGITLALGVTLAINLFPSIANVHYSNIGWKIITSSTD